MEDVEENSESGIVTYFPNGAPEYDPESWEDVSIFTNCFTYALDIPRHGWGRPGQLLLEEGCNLPVGIEQTKEFLIEEGLILVDGFDKAASDRPVVAGFVKADEDYHFYRLDRDGLWSHKPSDGLVEIKDNSGRLIEDPRQAARGGYKDFVGFFVIPEGGVSYYPRADDPFYSDYPAAESLYFVSFG